MILYVVRHGIAIPQDDPECPPDPERWLTPKGVDKTREAAEGLRALEITPEVFLTSPYVRAVQTAEIVAGVLGFGKGVLRETEALLPGAHPQDLFKMLRRVDAQEVICFGHAPHVDEVIGHALGVAHPVSELKKAGVAAIMLEALLPPRGTLMWLVTPKMLRFLGK